MMKWKREPLQIPKDLLDHLTDYRLSLASLQSEESEDAWWSVMIVLEDTSINLFEAAVRASSSDLLIPVAYDAKDRMQVLAHQPVTIFARDRLIRKLNRKENGLGVSQIYLGAQTPRRCLDHKAVPPNFHHIDVHEDTVVTAVIDDGIAIAHDLFRRDLTSTRIAHATVLGATCILGQNTTVGREFDAQEIDDLISNETYNDLLDESVFYQRAGVIDWRAQDVSPVAQQRSHGTHIAGIAAGHEIEEAPDTNPIVVVSLPTAQVADTTGFDLLPSLCIALQICRTQLRRFRKPDGTRAPAVANFSFGNAGGPHDGTGAFDLLFNFYFGAEAGDCDDPQTTWLTLPAGNLNLARLHASIGPKTQPQLDLSVLPDDGTPTGVEMWFPQDTDQMPQIKVTTPAGQIVTISAKPGEVAQLVNDNGDEIGRLACEYIAGSVQRKRVTLATHPTQDVAGRPITAPFGTWLLEFAACNDDSLPEIEVWIRRDETLDGARSGGRQAYFANADYTRFDRFGAPLATDPVGSDCPVRRRMTLSGFATGPTGIVVGGFSEKEHMLSGYSASGPSMPRDVPQNEGRQGPDVAAKSDDSLVRRGVISAGSNSGSWVRLAGTSVAAPRVARAAAERRHSWNVPARQWAKAAAQETPFSLEGPDLALRAGRGGITIKI